jgi:NTP pyrophosphatase (non-canonical NTP hydrolase)
MSFRAAQEEVDQWISGFEEGYFSPLSNVARLAEEVGELAREINHHYGEKTKKRGEERGTIADEMADILFVVLAMANSMQIDLDDAFSKMMEKYRRRDADRWTRKESREE